MFGSSQSITFREESGHECDFEDPDHRRSELLGSVDLPHATAAVSNGSKAPRKLVGVTSVKKRSSYVKRSANGFEMGISFGASSIHIDAPRLLGELLLVGVASGLGVAATSNRRNKRETALVSA